MRRWNIEQLALVRVFGIALVGTACQVASSDEPAAVAEGALVAPVGDAPAPGQDEAAALEMAVAEAVATVEATVGVDVAPPVNVCAEPVAIVQAPAFLQAVTVDDGAVQGESPVQCVTQDTCEKDWQAKIDAIDKSLPGLVDARDKAQKNFDATKKSFDAKVASAREFDKASLALAKAVAAVERAKATRSVYEAAKKLCDNPEDADARCSAAIAIERKAKADLVLATEANRVAKANVVRGLVDLEKRIINAQGFQTLKDAAARAAAALDKAKAALDKATDDVKLLCVEK